MPIFVKENDCMDNERMEMLANDLKPQELQYNNGTTIIRINEVTPDILRKLSAYGFQAIKLE